MYECPKCKGVGSLLVKRHPKDEVRPGNTPEITKCYQCDGEGELDWVAILIKRERPGLISVRFPAADESWGHIVGFA